MRFTRRTIAIRLLMLPYALTLGLGCSFDTYPVLTPLPPATSNAGGPSNAGLAPNGPAAADSAPTPSPNGLLPTSDAGNAREASVALDASDRAEASTPKDATTPATIASCTAGDYAGDFACVADPTGLAPARLSTRVTFKLVPSATSQELTIANSTLSFELAGFVFTGELAGRLNCATGAFEAALANGTFASTLLLPVTMPFSGAVDGQLDPAKPLLVGTWSFSALQQTCTGAWSAALHP
jgi:hypothetical protein